MGVDYKFIYIVDMIWLNNGHDLLSRGSWNKKHNEGEMTIALGEVVSRLLNEENISYAFVPDNLSLKESIAWINYRARADDLAVSWHFNSNNDTSIQGTEAYYSEDSNLAITFSYWVSENLGIRNRGAIHDSKTFVGSLGWLRKLFCRSVLVEVCYLSNEEDMEAYNVEQAGVGIVVAIKENIRKQKKEKITLLTFALGLANKLLVLLKLKQK